MKQDRVTATVPPPPPGFVLDGPQPVNAAGSSSASNIPPPPPGFELDHQEQADQPQDSDAVGRSRSFAQGFADIATFGLADEAAAAAGALGGMLPGGHGKGYSQLLGEIRAQSEADAAEHPYMHMTGQVGGGVSQAAGLVKGGLSLAANAAQAGKGWMARILGGAADGGLGAAAYGAGSGDSGLDRARKAADNLPLGVALGVGGEAIATGVGKGARWLVEGPSDVAPGVNAARNVSEAEQFGIPLSRSQATRSEAQANIENQLRSQGDMAGFDATQRGAVGRSLDDMQSQIAGDNPRIPSASAAYDDLQGALRGKQDRLKAASQDAYDASVNNPNVLVSGDALRDIPNFIRGKLDADQILIDPQYHQGASRAMSFIDDYIGRMPKPGGDVKDVQAQLRWVENMRAGLRKNFPPIGQDAPALKAISSAIDDWTDDVFDRGLVNASDDVLQELKTARTKWSEYKSMSDPRMKQGGRLNPRYEAQQRVRSIVDKDMSPEEVGKLLWGSSVASPKSASLMTAMELKKHLGADSPHWSAIRQSFWLRATRANDEQMNPVQIAKNLDGLLKGDGKGVADVLFSEPERKMMTAYTNVMRAMSPPRAGFNNSNTANRLMPTLQKYATGIITALASGGGYAGGLGPLESLGLGTATGMAARGLGQASRMGRLRAATTMPVPANPSGMGGATLRGAGAGGGLPILTDRNRGKLTVFKP